MISGALGCCPWRRREKPSRATCVRLREWREASNEQTEAAWDGGKQARGTDADRRGGSRGKRDRVSSGQSP